jgi:hypothetical protein
MTQRHTEVTNVATLRMTADANVRHPAAATYRELVSRGLDANAAANLTAFINGIRVGRQPWTIDEISHLLFLRELYRIGWFGPIDGDGR